MFMLLQYQQVVRKLRKIQLALIICSLASGCASIVSTTDSTTYIETDPPKARCVLHGQDFKRVLETPNSISLPSKAAPITIVCEAEGYKTTTAVLNTRMDGWIIGNIIFGGVIGAVVDGARGAGFKYPPQFSMVLEPEEFASVAARDAWYDTIVTDLKEKWVKEIKMRRAKCTNDDKTGCDSSVKAAEKLRDKELAILETRRAAAKLRGRLQP